MLGRAKDVIVVDAYFNPSVALAKSKWLRPIEAIASKLRGDGQLARFEVHALSSRHDPWQGGLFSDTVATIWRPLCLVAYRLMQCCGRSASAAPNSTSA